MRIRIPRFVVPAVAMATGLVSATAHADNVLSVGAVTLDPPTVVALGVRLSVSGDDNFDGAVTVRYRVHGASVWRTGLPLFRVHPQNVTGFTAVPEFAGSIFDLSPATQYDIELHAADPDGSVDKTLTINGTTRDVPRDPKNPNPKTVTDAKTLASALSAAKAGDVITLSNGTYAGTFSLDASGTADAPIVIRGESEKGVILDGGGCTGCNVVEVYGSFVHVERLTIAHASRALRFQGTGADSNVVRNVHVMDTTLGFGSNPDQKNFYICDNILEGRLSWPSVYTDDGGIHANDDGIHVEGNGHVVCHNRLTGFGDSLKTEQDGARAVDFYGNDVLTSYDNGLELDGSSGNARCFRNRFTNTYATLSYQPIFGGPAYTFRNIVVNVVNEQMKFHANGTLEPSGMLVYHNTFVSSGSALSLHDDATSHHFTMENNLFVSAPSATGRTMDWTGTIDDGTFDYDGFFPDGVVDFNYQGSGYTKYTSFALAQAAGVGFETHGLILGAPIFANGLTALPTYTTALVPPDVTLASGSNAIDRGILLANIDDGFTGNGPDLGAVETGCPQPIYGPRPEGTDETNEPMGCVTTGVDGGVPSSGGAASAGGAAGSGSGGTAGAAGAASGGVGASGGRGTSGGNAAGAAPGSDAGTAGGSASSNDKGGCGCRTSSERGSSGATLVLALALLGASLRRGRRVPGETERVLHRARQGPGSCTQNVFGRRAPAAP
jgi:MYXO-CTERM domain-containing protein